MSEADDSRRALLGHVLVPVAQEADARKTARGLAPYDPDQVTAVHVVEKAGGAPDKTPVEHSHEVAADCYAAIQSVFPAADTHTAYGRNVVETILQAADEVGATAIVYRSRGGNRLMHFLSGDQSLKLVTRADRPVIALPRAEDDER